MKGFDTQEAINTSSIENWTLLQCKEYLEKYPKGLKSEQIRKRMESLHVNTVKSATSSSSTRKSESSVKSTNRNTQNNNGGGNSSNADSTVKKDDSSVWDDILGPILVVIGLIIIFVISIQFTEWLAALGIPIAAIYGIYSIYNYFAKK